MDPAPGDVGVAVPVQEELDVADLVALAVRAEELGYSTVWSGEIAGPEAFALLGAVAAGTHRIRLGTAVVSIHARSVALTAMGFATLAGLAPGRFVAGVGVGSRFTTEHWHDGEFVDTAGTLREVVTVLRPLLAGEKVAHRGDHVALDSFRVTVPVAGDIPIHLGAMSPHGLRLAGEIADGVVLAFCPVAEIGTRVAVVREAAVAAGRDPDAVEIVAYLNCYAGDDPHGAVERMRRLIVQYAVQPTHAPSFEGVFADLAEAQRLWANGDRRSAAALVTDEVVAAVAPVGDGDMIAERLEAMRSAGVTEPVVFPQVPTPGDAAGIVGTVDAVADALSRRAAPPRP